MRATQKNRPVITKRHVGDGAKGKPSWVVGRYGAQRGFGLSSSANIVQH
jgi:hypothetical protein